MIYRQKTSAATVKPPAMQGSVDDMHQQAEQFLREAKQLKAIIQDRRQRAAKLSAQAAMFSRQADSIAATLPIMRWETVPGIPPASSTRELVVDESATSERQSQVDDLRQQAAELHAEAEKYTAEADEKQERVDELMQSANKLTQTADALEEKIAEANALFAKISEAKNDVEHYYAGRAQELIDRLEDLIHRIGDLRDSVGNKFTSEADGMVYFGSSSQSVVTKLMSNAETADEHINILAKALNMGWKQLISNSSAIVLEETWKSIEELLSRNADNLTASHFNQLARIFADMDYLGDIERFLRYIPDIIDTFTLTDGGMGANAIGFIPQNVEMLRKLGMEAYIYDFMNGRRVEFNAWTVCPHKIMGLFGALSGLTASGEDFFISSGDDRPILNLSTITKNELDFIVINAPSVRTQETWSYEGLVSRNFTHIVNNERIISSNIITGTRDADIFLRTHGRAYNEFINSIEAIRFRDFLRLYTGDKFVGAAFAGTTGFVLADVAATYGWQFGNLVSGPALQAGLKKYGGGIVGFGLYVLFSWLEYLGARNFEEMERARNIAIGVSIYNAQAIAALSYSIPIDFKIEVYSNFVIPRVFEVHNGSVTTSDFVTAVNNNTTSNNVFGENGLTVEQLLSNPIAFNEWWESIGAANRNTILNDMNNPAISTPTPTPTHSPSPYKDIHET